MTYDELVQEMIRQVPREQYERYTSNYMAMMTGKVKLGSKSKLSKYDKDLIQD